MKTKLYHKLTAAVCALVLLLSLAPAAYAADGSGGKWSGIISSPYTYFNTSSAILSDGTLRVWYCYADVSGKQVTDSYEVIDMGTGYQSLGMSSMALLKADGTAWQLGMPHDYSDQTPLGGNVRQLTSQGYTQLRKDGTVYTMRPYQGEAYPNNQAYITGDAKQVVETAGFGGSVFYVLKNDGSLWSWSDYDYSDPIPLLGRGESAKGETYGKIMDGVAFAAPGMAIKTDGSLWSWGDEMTVGSGSDSAAYTPAKIMDNVVGAWSSENGELRYALTADGTLYSWGRIYGAGDCIALGYSSTDKEKRKSSESVYQYQSVPRKVNFDDAVAVAPGYGRLIVQKSDGSIWAIGNVGSLPCRTVEAGEEEKITDFRKVMDGVKLPEAVASSAAPSTPATPATPNTPAASAQFADVPATHWAYSDITACAEKQIVTGTGNGKFDPDGQVTGIQFIVMLTRTFYSDAVEAAKAAETSNWYAPNMKAAADAGMTSGVSEAGLSESKAMTRYDMAQILYNAIVHEGKALGESDSRLAEAAASIKDWSGIPQAYQTAVRECCAQGIITGVNGGSFAGANAMTRAQACTVIQRMVKLING